MEEKFSMVNRTKLVLPLGRQAFLSIKNDILGKKYSLSIAFIGEKESQTINNQYRGKDNSTNILSFPLTKEKGEILLCLKKVQKESKDKEKNFGKNYRELLGFLVIHGMLHLKGFEHSSTMERIEKEYDQKYFGRHRHRIVHDKSRGRRIHQRRKKS